MYTLSFTTPFEYVESVRALLGVTVSELPDDTIMTLAIIGQAEQDILSAVPNMKAIIEDTNTTVLRQNQLMIAFINFIAFYAYSPLKVSLLSSESDNKTIATRFKDAFARDPNEFKAAAIKALTQAGISIASGHPDLLSLYKSNTDIITGNAQ